MSFLFSWIRLTLCLFNVVWTNTIVEVPLDEDINRYIEVPQALLYNNGILIENAQAYYQRTGVNRTFLSTVNTSYVKSYYIYYEVFFERYDTRDVTQIEFSVVDITPPEIKYLPTFSIEYGEDLPIYESFIRFEDNYDDVESIRIDIDDSRVNLSKVGIYDIYISVTDTSFNVSHAKTTLSILDKTAPSMTLIKPIILDVGTPFIIDDFIEIKDNYDIQVSVQVIDDQLDIYILGNYEMTVIATDLSQNITIETFLVSVVDRESPVLILKSYPEPIEVYQDLNDFDLLSYVLLVSDNHDEIDLNHILYHHDIDTTRVGSYKIYYEVSDQSFNKCEKVLNIEVADLEKPTIEIIIPFVFEVFSDQVSLYDHFLVKDNYCAVDDLEITIKTSYKLDIIGRYDLTIEVIDLYKNKTTYRGFIEVVDLIAPVITEITDIILTDFTKKDLTIYYQATDQYDQGNVQLIIDDGLVDYEHIGIYDIYIYAYDRSQNEAILKSSVMIIDVTTPILTLNTHHVNISVSTQIEDLKQYIKEASDNYDDLSVDDVTITEDINIDQVGAYEVLYKLKDQSYNEATQKLMVYVNDYDHPIIEGNDLYIDMYETINLLEGLTIKDNVEVYRIYYEPNIINTSIPGSYEITYIATDQSGNATQFIRSIHINETPQSYDIVSFIPIMITTLISVSILYYLYKKM